MYICITTNLGFSVVNFNELLRELKKRYNNVFYIYTNNI